MSDRGEYRSIHTVLVDDPEFQAFSPEAKLLFYTLKLQLGPTSIGIIPAAEAVLSEQTGIPSEGVRDGMIELREAGWLRSQRNVYWLVNGLKFDPSLTITNENHATSVRKRLKALPKLDIANAFAGHYGLDPPFPDTPSAWDREGGTDGMGDHGRRNTETEDGNRNRGSEGSSLRSSPSGASPDVENGQQDDESNPWGATVDACRESLWLGEDPPRGRSIGEELSVAKQLLERWKVPRAELLEAIDGFARLRSRGFWEGWIDRDEPACLTAMNRVPDEEDGIPVFIRCLHEARKGDPGRRKPDEPSHVSEVEIGA